MRKFSTHLVCLTSSKSPQSVIICETIGQMFSLLASRGPIRRAVLLKCVREPSVFMFKVSPRLQRHFLFSSPSVFFRRAPGSHFDTLTHSRKLSCCRRIGAVSQFLSEREAEHLKYSRLISLPFAAEVCHWSWPIPRPQSFLLSSLKYRLAVSAHQLAVLTGVSAQWTSCAARR